MFADAQKKRKNPQLARTGRDELAGGIKQRRLANLQIGAAHPRIGLAGADLHGNRLNGRAPLRLTRAVGKQDNAERLSRCRGHGGIHK